MTICYILELVEIMEVVGMDIVRYDNVLNELCFSGFEAHDFDFFMCICSKMYGVCDICEIGYEELMVAVSWDRRQNLDKFHHELKRMCVNLRRVGGVIDVDSDEFVVFNLFSTFRANCRKKILTVRVNPDFSYILNDLTRCFTCFELQEYVSLKGRYAKQLYQQLKQYKNTGWLQLSVEDIRRKFSIPETYGNKYIMDKAIKPAIEVVSSCRSFSGLTVEVVRSSGRGRSVSAYKFTWELPVSQDKRENKKAAKSKNSFCDIQQHQYNFEELERELVENNIPAPQADPAPETKKKFKKTS